MLLGDWLDCKSLNMVLKKLVRDLKSKCKMDINESFLKLVLGGANFNIEEAGLSQQCLKKGCYIGMLERHGEENFRSNGIDNVSALASQLIREAVNELHVEDTSREPIILVLDCDVQVGKIVLFNCIYFHLGAYESSSFKKMSPLIAICFSSSWLLLTSSWFDGSFSSFNFSSLKVLFFLLCCKL